MGKPNVVSNFGIVFVGNSSVSPNRDGPLQHFHLTNLKNGTGRDEKVPFISYLPLMFFNPKYWYQLEALRNNPAIERSMDVPEYCFLPYYKTKWITKVK